MNNTEECRKTAVTAKEEVLTDNSEKEIQNTTPNLLPKIEYLLKAIKDFSSRYDKDNRNILKNKKFLVTFDDLMTLIKDTINSQNKINDLNDSEIEKLKDVTQDFINNLSYTIFSFEKIDALNKDDKSNLNSSTNIQKKNSFNTLNSKNSLFNSNSNSNKINGNIVVNKNNNRNFLTDENANSENLRNLLYKKHKSSNNFTTANSNKKKNISNCKKNNFSLNALSNKMGTKNITYTNFTTSYINKSKSGSSNIRYEVPPLTDSNNILSNTLENLIIENKNNKFSSHIDSSLAISIPTRRIMTPKKFKTQKIMDVSSKKMDKNVMKISEKQKIVINKNTSYGSKNKESLKSINNTKKNSQNVGDKNFGSRTSVDFTKKNNNSQTKNKRNFDINMLDKENKSSHGECPKQNEKNKHKETVVYQKNNNGEMRILYREFIDIPPRPSNMANKILESNRKYINEFNEMKNEKRKEKRKK